MAERKSSSVLTAPLRGAASVLGRVPGAAMVGKAAQETLDKVGVVSPRGRRVLVYAGAGVLGVTGVVEWPVALAGAAVAWLTQPRPAQQANGHEKPRTEETHEAAEEPAHDLGSAALRSGTEAHHQEPPGPVKATPANPARTGAHTKGSTGPLGPTARPERTSL
ncbi:hypothetical protein GTW40_08040 [Streptomyces sp. SID4985]|uniref:hypothetical protein n=1 Tax=Streptomyces sp. SID4985 TaxID=2690292 RepID=UPI00136D1DF6|nr:hypothetical protein [Streptomyces sp. SID4985]MYQ45008.1 hypothetical protein [Streptomyces sp. SID4985]